MAMVIEPAELARRLNEPDVVVVDCRFNLLEPAAGRLAWSAGHIPGAYYADLDRDLSAPRQPDTGRHPLPDVRQFAALLGGWGVQPDSLVVGYDDVGGAVAARLWWLLRWVGHSNAALLDGGWQAWQRSGLPTDEGSPAEATGTYPVTPGMMPVLTTAEVESGLADGSLALLDARDPGRFAGVAEPIDTRAGHIPGTINYPFQKNLDGERRFLAAETLRDQFERVLNGAGEQQLASMCGSGVTACHNLFALERAGIRDGNGDSPALYVGSWSEWITDTDRPIETERN